MGDKLPMVEGNDRRCNCTPAMAKTGDCRLPKFKAKRERGRLVKTGGVQIRIQTQQGIGEQRNF